MKGTREHSTTKRVWPNRDATTCFPVRAQGKNCSGYVHSLDVEEVGLPSPLLAEGQFVDCVMGARFSLGEKFKSRRRQLQLHQFTLTFPPVKQKPMTDVQH